MSIEFTISCKGMLLRRHGRGSTFGPPVMPQS